MPTATSKGEKGSELGSRPDKLVWVPIKNLHFDPANPRLPSDIDGTKEKAVFEWMLSDATLTELMAAIGEQGYFPGEPLLVVPHDSRPEHYVVVEGNRRLAAVKLLSDPDRAPVRMQTVSAIAESANEKPAALPVLPFKQRGDIVLYLGYRHVTGVQEWGPIAKARFLDQLVKSQGGKLTQAVCDRLARVIGSKGDYVARLFTGLRLYEKLLSDDFLDENEMHEEEISFSVFTTALNYQSIADFVGLDSGRDFSLKGLEVPRLKELFLWLFKPNSEGVTRIGESRNLKRLARVVARPRAYQAFRRGMPLYEADQLTGEPGRVFTKALSDALSRLETANSQAPLVEEHPSADAETLKEISSVTKHLRGVVEGKLKETTDDDE